MKNFERYSRILPWCMALMLSALVAGCGGGGSGGQDPILGTGAAGVVPFPPSVTAVAPVNNATGVPINNTIITAAFSKDMNAATINTSTFTLVCPVGRAITGTVAYMAASRVATFTPAAALPPSTVCTATITTGATDTTGLTLVSNFAWTFTTGFAPDTTRPRVLLTIPASLAVNVATNSTVSAVFSEDIAPATVNTSTFMLSCALPCVAPGGAVTYSVSTRTGIFTPNTALTPGTVYTATVTTGVTDLVGNTLSGNQLPAPAASNYVWTFTTASVVFVPPVPGESGNVSVLSTNPAAGASAVCPNASVNATFSVPSGARMDPATVTSGTFTVTGPGPAFGNIVAASVVLDAATGRIATFTPLNPLIAGVTYIATMRGGTTGVKDATIPANPMSSNFVWNFSVVTCQLPPVLPPSIPLGSASSFGTFGGSAGVTNQGLLSVINGDMGTTAVSTAVTGFHDAGPGCTYTETPLNAGTVNGKIYTAAPPPTVACPTEGTATTAAIAAQARADALIAYNALVAQPGGTDPGAGNLGSLVLAPGTYTAAAGSFRIQGGNLTLDAQGNANAVWVFQMATTLTVGGPGAAFPQSITLVNGAQAKNVYWQVGSAATINAGGGGTMVGTIISQAGATFSTAGNVTVVTLNGRVLSLGASVTMVNTVINVPAQ
ncbi:MAG: ice-binding family protein [Burkholderiales bacterium]|nr:ice-binding family protein [Burkholderiales bacterium]